MARVTIHYEVLIDNHFEILTPVHMCRTLNRYSHLQYNTTLNRSAHCFKKSLGSYHTNRKLYTNGHTYIILKRVETKHEKAFYSEFENDWDKVKHEMCTRYWNNDGII